MFVEYLKLVRNGKWEAIEGIKPERIDLSWQTKNNVHDCGVFVMRHMEMYKESRQKNWDCGFKLEKTNRQKQQLNKLRKKYAAKIVLSTANIHREDVIKKALEWEKKKIE
jgi:hypothetical protein